MRSKTIEASTMLKCTTSFTLSLSPLLDSHPPLPLLPRPVPAAATIPPAERAGPPAPGLLLPLPPLPPHLPGLSARDQPSEGDQDYHAEVFSPSKILSFLPISLKNFSFPPISLKKFIFSHIQLYLPPKFGLFPYLALNFRLLFQLFIFPLSVLQGVGESVRGVVREEVDSALQKHAHSISPEARAMEERARKEVSLSPSFSFLPRVHPYITERKLSDYNTQDGSFCRWKFAPESQPATCRSSLCIYNLSTSLLQVFSLMSILPACSYCCVHFTASITCITKEFRIVVSSHVSEYQLLSYCRILLNSNVSHTHTHTGDSAPGAVSGVEPSLRDGSLDLRPLPRPIPVPAGDPRGRI